MFDKKAEEIANKRCHEIMCYGHCGFNSPKHHRCGEWHREYNCAFAGLKAGRPQWHKVADELPTSDEDKYYFVVDKMNVYMIARFYEGKWSNYAVIEDVIAWCEIPTFDKE